MAEAGRVKCVICRGQVDVPHPLEEGARGCFCSLRCRRVQECLRAFTTLGEELRARGRHAQADRAELLEQRLLALWRLGAGPEPEPVYACVRRSVERARSHVPPGPGADAEPLFPLPSGR